MREWRLRLLLGVVALLLERGSGSSRPHSLRISYTMVSEPGPGLPQFIVVAYVDDQAITCYDSHTRRMVPLTPWMSKVEQDDPSYWDVESWALRHEEEQLRKILVTLQDHFHQNSRAGLHTLQLLTSCEVWPDERPRGGSWQYAYDGEDLMAFDKETLTWQTLVPQTEILKQKLDSLLDDPQTIKHYLEGPCVEYLRKYLDYGNKSLQRTEAPTWKVARKKGYDGQETLICCLRGFYPKEINVTWMKYGKDQKGETLTGGIFPNSDGTYHTWLSIHVHSKERDCYRCWVEHDSLLEPLDLAWEEPASNVGLIVGICAGVLLVGILLVAGVICISQQPWP